MASIYNEHDYYKKMLELQEKLRKSEEERIRLEERFKILVQESRNRHDACINRLRLRYIEFLEQQRTRDERNHKLLGALERIDSSLALMTAKTDRLNVLRKQYEVYLLRAYANRGPPGSVTGDSGIASQNEERCSRRNFLGGQANLVPSEVKSVSSPRIFRSCSQATPSISFFAPKISESIQNVPYDNRKIYETGEPVNAPIDLQMYPGSAVIRNVPSEHFSTDAYQSPAVFQESPFRGTQNSLQADSKMQTHQHAPIPMPQISPLNQQNIRCLNKSSVDKMDPVQTAASLMMSKPANGTASQYKLEETVGNRIASPISERQFGPSQPVQYYNGRLLSDSSHVQIRNKEHSAFPLSRTAPAIIESNLPATFPAPLSSNRQIGSLPSYMDYSSRNSRDARSTAKSPKPSLTSSDLDEMIRRNELLMPTSANVRRIPRRLSTLPKPSSLEEEESKETVTLENELDRYISKIKNLHRELDMQSLDELDQEQNTSGDLLNVSLSDDDLDLPSENKPKKEQLPEEVEKVLALASDLVSTTVSGEVADDFGKHRESKNREPIQRSNESASNGSRVALSDVHEGREGRVALVNDGISNDTTLHRPELDQHVEKLRKPAFTDLDHGNVPESQLNAPRAIDTNRCEGEAGFIVPSDEKIVRKNTEREGRKEEPVGVVCSSAEPELDRAFDVVDDFESENVEQKQKEIQEIVSNNVDKDQTTEKEVVIEPSTSEDTNTDEHRGKISELSLANQASEEKILREENVSFANQSVESVSELRKLSSESEESVKLKTDLTEKEILERSIEGTSVPTEKETEEVLKTPEDNRETETDAASALPSNIQEGEIEETKEEEPKENGSALGTDEKKESRLIEQDKDRSIGEEYIEESNEAPGYIQDPGQNFTEVTQDYTYDQTTPYESKEEAYPQEYSNEEYANESNEQYEGYAGYTQYEQDPNAQYQQDPNAQYAEDPNAQYAQDPNAQYEQDPNAQYAQDPNAQYAQDPNAQYAQDPNAQYEQDPNAQYMQDPNAQYAQDSNAQYEQDPNVQYAQDPNAQYEQDPNAQYAQDPNAQYEQDPNQYLYNYEEQYDANQAYENDPNHAYEYTENVAYEPSQASGPAHEEQKVEQREIGEHREDVKSEESREQKTEAAEEEVKVEEKNQEQPEETSVSKKKKDVIKSLLDSDTESTIERNVSNTESDFDFN